MNILNMPIQDVVSLIREHFPQPELFKEIESLNSRVDETLLKEPYLVLNFNFECELPELPEMELIEPQCKIVCGEDEESLEPISETEFLDSAEEVFDNMNFVSKVTV